MEPDRQSFEDISVITISNEPEKVENMLGKLHFVPKEHIFVVDDVNKFQFLNKMDRMIVIQTKSRNFAYLVNLGISLASAYWVMKIDSDEYLDKNAILALHSLSRDYNAYSIEKMAKFFDIYPNYLKRNSIVVHARSIAFYEGRVDEKVNKKKLKIGIINGILYNESYNTFDTFKRKFKKYSSMHEKNFKEFFRKLFGELYIFFKTNAFLDGLIGLKFLFYGLMFPFSIIFNGIKEYNIHSIQDVESKLIMFSDKIDVRERTYILNVLNILKNGSLTREEFKENLEQVSSPFAQFEAQQVE